MSIKQLILETEEGYREKQYRNNSVSIEMKMIIDDATSIGPFIQMFCLDDFRKMSYSEIEQIVMDTTAHIARTFALVILNRPDCLNGDLGEKASDL